MKYKRGDLYTNEDGDTLRIDAIGEVYIKFSTILHTSNGKLYKHEGLPGSVDFIIREWDYEFEGNYT